MFLPLLSRLVPWLPPPLRRLATPERTTWMAQFMAFGCVGVVGFAVDTAVVYGTRAWLGLYGAGLVAYFAAATGNWILNRIWTFHGPHAGPAHRQWGLFVAANAVGFVLNRGTYALLVTFVPLCAQEPVLAIMAGSIAGMFVNFHFSRTVVFRERPGA